jgi:hypothetical protein
MLPSTANETKILIDDTLSRSSVKELLRNLKRKSCFTRTESPQPCYPKHFSPSSVQLKSEINGAFLCKRHQQRHLEFCTVYLLSRMS